MSEDLSEEFRPDDLAAAGALEASPDPGYTWPSDPVTRRALEHWRDHKVGVIIHWGIYSSIGLDGSWSLHRQHLGDFTDPPASWSGTDEDYHTWYCDQARTFTGVDFDADEWARACQEAGMRYVVFTTKHHDGFAMYDTDFSNFKSTGEDAGLGRDIVREVFDAFRARGMETGVYFSKADWNHPGYWDRSKPLRDRFHNYDIAAHPAKWRSFVDMTKNQIEELLTRYGPVNVLWLDAGWVCEPREPIDMDRIADRARALQPGILVVDREVHGRNEDYRTPEQEVPDSVLDHPWESCITMTRGWCSMRRDDPIKPMRHIISNLLAIVSRGGNYLIGVGPDATGAMSVEVKKGLAELGRWMRANGEGIHSTRALAEPLQVEGEDGWSWYATGTKEDCAHPGRIHLFGMPPAGREQAEASVPATHVEVALRVGGVRVLGAEDEDAASLTWQQGTRAGLTRIEVPDVGARHAVGLVIDQV
ncbi:alpha-L-fucosidase [Schaalia sp. 19OD2882]|uniref:alpha-L-fucosidase n=1 Tax=Schaalia sp. 19OD2882 TaxID=2794089 RepID=UPI001C1F0048|nr:alpha-L-fucosidase [Schaalia sp. 19OD2882]QWW19225.1 alpha-L-fucosidase [Schaalia sp. 19OD2882]